MVDINIEKRALYAHAGNMDTASDGVKQAGDAATTVSVGGDAFGLMFNFFVPEVTAFLTAEGSAINAVPGAITSLAAGLRKASDELTGTDSDARISFEAVPER